jgi:hypothetical protein
MKPFLTILLLISCITVSAQDAKKSDAKLWTEADRKYTVDNFKRTRDALIKETEGLTPAQWSFRESPDRWTIGEVVEHLGTWERAWSREIDMATRNKPQPELNATCRPDSYYTEFINEEKKHDAPPFAKPTGLIVGKDNMSYFLAQHQLNLKYVETTSLDMRAYFEQTAGDPRNLHQVLLFQWGHVDRHIRQIKKIKEDSRYPK